MQNNTPFYREGVTMGQIRGLLEAWSEEMETQNSSLPEQINRLDSQKMTRLSNLVDLLPLGFICWIIENGYKSDRMILNAIGERSYYGQAKPIEFD